jgi:serine/threonine-protein kinase
MDGEMSATTSIDRQTFLANVRRSGLVDETALSRMDDRLPSSERGRLVARAMVDMGVLTRFQAERLLIGRTSGFVLGPYRILDQLGKGGMGRVYKAQHIGLGRIVALKVLAPDLLKTERAHELFHRELQAAGQLNHPNAVTALDANEIDGRVFLVLEFVDGPNLEQLVREQGPLSVGLACDYIRQAALALQAAHALGMVHRDIKPANLLVQRRGLDADAPGLLKVTDFGLARLCDPQRPGTNGTLLLKPNTVMGTPDYVSPEQARDVHKVDIRSDLYSLGCSMYFMLTGRVPFPGGDALEKMIRQATVTAQPVGAFRPDVPVEVVKIVERLMAKHPNQRFQTPAELVEALTPFAVSGPIPWAQAARPTLDETTAVPTDSSGELEMMSPTDSIARRPTDDDIRAAVPAECVQAMTAEERHRQQVMHWWVAGAVLAANALVWWAVMHWIG